jgi:murein DD-endopeptidase MepM/ murein hydrolase activator NlpD
MSSNPPPVPKPNNAGSGSTAIAEVRTGFVNIRNGPGTQYRDIGDLRNNTLVAQFPPTRTADGWMWIEQYGVGGWVLSSALVFTPTTRPAPITPQTATPYDGKVGVWYWKGDGLTERTIDEVAVNIKRLAPNVSQLWVKTNDGPNWMGRFDRSPLAINGPADIDRWVNGLARRGLEFHAWCVLQGQDINGEANVLTQICTRPGVRSMVLDIEPYQGFWQAGKDPIRPLMVNVRRALPPNFHISMAVDPRPAHYHTIFPMEWFPFINSVHLQTYWDTFRRDYDDVLNEGFRTWANYGRPLFPILPGDAELGEVDSGHTLSTQRLGGRGLSWWRYGTIRQSNWSVVNRTPSGNTDGPPPGGGSGGTIVYGNEVVVRPNDAGFASGSYTGRDEFERFLGSWGWVILSTSTEPSNSKVWAQWSPNLTESGLYEVAAFIPTRNSTTNNARYKVHGPRGVTGELLVTVDQARERNLWTILGTYQLDKANKNTIFLNDVTGERGRMIAFDAIRWRRVLQTGGGSTDNPTPPPPGVADGFDSPVGSEAERRGARAWPAGWADASPFAKLYLIGTPNVAYHTGADLNFGAPYADKGMPVYSPASGTVIYQAELRPWGNLTIIRHDPLRTATGTVVYSRYGHMQNVRVRVGQRVRRGDQIGEIGDANGRFIPHLHYDIVTSTVLETKPGDWPGLDLARLLRHYTDPLEFTRNNRPR